MQISDVISNLNLSGIRTTNSTESDAAAKAEGSAKLANMANGDTFTGEVIAKNGDQATIRLDGGGEINALLSKDMNIGEGRNIAFQVVRNNGDSVAIRTLFNNNSQEMIATGALNEAGIDVNAKSMLMMSDLLNNNMPIDKNSLNSLYQKILANPDIDQSNMVKLSARGFELSNDNLGKLNALVNFEERVSSTVSSLIDDIPNELTKMINNGDTAGAMKLFSDISNALNNVSADGTTLAEGTINAAANANGEAAVNGAVNAESAEVAAKVIISDAQGEVINSAGQDATANVVNNETGNAAANVVETTISNAADTVISLGAEGAENAAASSITLEDATKLSQILNNLNDNLQITPKDIMEGNVDVSKLMADVSKALSEDPQMASHMKNLMDNDAFNVLMKNELKDMWLLNPEKLAKDGDVTEFYNRLNSQVHSIASSMSETLAASGNLSESLNALSQNLEFLNDLNQFVAYVQLPLNMEGEAANGDLYVFANKKSLAEKDDNLTALLHLDMENLGPLDVYVKLSADTHISTNFTVANDDVLDFLEAHMEMLTSRLESKGYSIENSFNISSDTTGINEGFSQILADKNGEKPKDVISFNGFDVRA